MTSIRESVSEAITNYNNEDTPDYTLMGTSEQLETLCSMIEIGATTVTIATGNSSGSGVHSIISSVDVDSITNFGVNNYWLERIRTSQINRSNIEGIESLLPSDSPIEIIEEAEAPLVLTPEEETLLQTIIESENNEPPSLIPTNSPTILMEENNSRFSGAIWYENIRTKVIMVAGLGGIGSYVTFLLSRMNPDRLYLYDDDIVETANMSGQLYSLDNVGNSKASSISSMIKNYSNYYRIHTENSKYTVNSPYTKIMICGFDNMEARKVFYTNWKRQMNPAGDSECLFIDGRLAAEEFQVFCIQGDDKRAMSLYEKEWLFDDSDAEETLCSYKQTTFMANMIGSVMVNLFTNFVANQCDPIFPRAIPFMTTYDASIMHFKVEI